MTKNRFEALDLIKGIAVIHMILFHISYDLDFFHFIDIEMTKDPFWYCQPKIIMFMFLICVGMGVSLGHRNKIKWDAILKRTIKIGLVAISISIVTYFLLKGRWIFFGILHNITISSLLALAFIRIPKISLALGIALIVPTLIYGYQYPFFRLSARPVDHVALFPYFGCVLIGIFLYEMGLHKVRIPSFPMKKYVLFLGKHSLKVYIIHQMILFPLVYGLYQLTQLFKA